MPRHSRLLFSHIAAAQGDASKSLIVSHATIRTGILQDMLPSEQGKRIRRFSSQILSAARSLGRRYQYDEGHAERVRELAVLLFDEIRSNIG